jgi:chromate transport protein ChrA
MASDSTGQPAAALRENAATLTTVAAALTGLAGAWIAAGSTGLLAHPFRHGLMIAALVLAVILAWPRGKNRWVAMGLLAAAAVAAVFLLSSALPPLSVLAVALVLLALAEGRAPQCKQALRVVAEAVVLLAIYRIAPTAWAESWAR